MSFLTIEEATHEIRRRAEDSNNIIFTKHAFQRMDERDLDQLEVIKCLRRGTVHDEPERENESKPYKYKMDFRNGRTNNSVVVTIEARCNLLIVTVY